MDEPIPQNNFALLGQGSHESIYWIIQKYNFCLSVALIITIEILFLKSASCFLGGKFAGNGQYRFDIGL